jgi:hypothetical protein
VQQFAMALVPKKSEVIETMPSDDQLMQDRNIMSVTRYMKAGDIYDFSNLRYCLWLILGANTENELIGAARRILEKTDIPTA